MGGLIILNWTKSRNGKKRIKQTPAWIKLHQKKKKKKRIKQNPEKQNAKLNNISNGQNLELDEAPNWTDSKICKVQKMLCCRTDLWTKPRNKLPRFLMLQTATIYFSTSIIFFSNFMIESNA